jgi:formylglycine-generating enzyme required for sulfatase activity
VHDGDFFFDNETPRHRVWLDAFESASRPINQGGFLDFMNDGG